MSRILWIRSAAVGFAVWVGLQLVSHFANVPAVEAQSDFSYLYIEPETTVIRDPANGTQVQGKIVIDRRTGDILGISDGFFGTVSGGGIEQGAAGVQAGASGPIRLRRYAPEVAGAVNRFGLD